MKPIALVVLAVLIGMVSFSAQARKPRPVVEAAGEYVNKPLPAGANVWYCRYDGEVAILCELGEIGDQGEGAGARPVAALDPRLPALVGTVWHRPAELAEAVITIPLHSLPYDMDYTGRLADAVMCGGSSAACGVLFASNAEGLAALVRQRTSQLAARKIGSLAMAE